MKIHKTVEIEEGAQIGEGTTIWNNSQVKKRAIIGERCTIGHNCFIDNGAKLGNGIKLESNIDVWEGVTLKDFVFVGPSVVFTNDFNPRAKYPKKEYPEYGKWKPTLVKEGTTIGANATIVCGVTLGKHSFIGAGAVVIEDVPDYGLVVGNPAKKIGWMCECGNRIEFEDGKGVCETCKRKYLKKDNRVKLKE
jgi:UDP-2-acetamido-3-amino-2,3-dideoxy-glucuronate N-acetyltransferase